MKIGTRITLTTSALVALTLGVYGFVTLRAARTEREEQLERQARELAAALRVVIENDALTRPDPTEPPFDRWVAQRAGIVAELQRFAVPWRVEFLSLPSPDVQPGDPAIERLQRMIAARAPVEGRTRIDGRVTYVFLEPVRVPAPMPLYPDGFRIVGAIQVSRDLASVDAAVREETTTIVLSMVMLIAILLVAVLVSTRRGIGRPIQKLIAGIDDVAKGDLSHVLLQERDDEIGALAARFNDMTKSLRDARAETRRGVEERLSLEAHLRNTSQLATIGQLAAEIAHEVGTPLNVVTGRARAMAKKADDPEAVEKNATIIAEQAGRITRIIQRLLDVARRKVGGPAREGVDLNTLAEGTLELLEHQIAHARVQPSSELAPSLPSIPGDKDQLQQVLLNLFMNAIQAMPSGGRLTVRTSRVLRRRPGLEVAPEHEYAVLTVADSGVGIPEKDRAKIFEAFYTSRGEKGGTGLGLAVAHGIVKDHDGWIEIEDNPGGGTVFQVYLPLATAEGAAIGTAVMHNPGA